MASQTHSIVPGPLQEEESSIYTKEQIALVREHPIPFHIAIIPDGNRRWAKRQKISSILGHRKGADVLMDIVKASKELGIKVITIYVFSTENWVRNEEEVKAFLWLLESFLLEKRQSMIDQNVKLQTIGELSRFSKQFKEVLQETIEATSSCNGIEMVFALNYGGRDEIKRAIQTICEDYKNERFDKEEVTEKLISRYLDTAGWPDPDLLIRTSGELRVSNFLIWQTSYAEIYTTTTLWPDFTTEELWKAILNYQQRTRRWGT